MGAHRRRVWESLQTRTLPDRRLPVANLPPIASLKSLIEEVHQNDELYFAGLLDRQTIATVFGTRALSATHLAGLMQAREFTVN